MTSPAFRAGQRALAPGPFYVASGLGNIVEARRLIALLTSWGLRCTYDWTAHGPVWADGEARLREVAQRETDGVKAARLIVARLPGGRGTHGEFVAGCALGRSVILYGAPDDFVINAQTCAFYWHPRVVARVTNDAGLATAVRRVFAGAKRLVTVSDLGLRPPKPVSVAGPPVRRLADMTAEEKAELGRRYNAKVKT